MDTNNVTTYKMHIWYVCLDVQMVRTKSNHKSDIDSLWWWTSIWRTLCSNHNNYYVHQWFDVCLCGHPHHVVDDDDDGRYGVGLVVWWRRCHFTMLEMHLCFPIRSTITLTRTLLPGTFHNSQCQCNVT